MRIYLDPWREHDLSNTLNLTINLTWKKKESLGLEGLKSTEITRICSFILLALIRNTL